MCGDFFFFVLGVFFGISVGGPPLVWRNGVFFVLYILEGVFVIFVGDSGVFFGLWFLIRGWGGFGG